MGNAERRGTVELRKFSTTEPLKPNQSFQILRTGKPGTGLKHHRNIKMDFLDENEIIVTVKDEPVEYIIKEVPGDKIILISGVRTLLAVVFFITELEQETSSAAYRILQLGFMHCILTSIGAFVGFYAGFKLTAPAAMLQQLMSVCLTGLQMVIIFFMLFSYGINIHNFIDHSDYHHGSLAIAQVLLAIIDLFLNCSAFYLCKKAFDSYLRSYAAKDELRKEFPTLYSPSFSPSYQKDDYLKSVEVSLSHRNSPRTTPQLQRRTNRSPNHSPKLILRREIRNC